MAMKIEDIPGPYKLLHVGSDLTFSQLGALQDALASGIRSRQIFWCLDCSGVTKISPAVTAVFVGVAGGLRAFGGDLHSTVGQVANRTRQPQLPGLVQHEGTIVDPLHPAGDKCVQALPGRVRCHA